MIENEPKLIGMILERFGRFWFILVHFGVLAPKREENASEMKIDYENFIYLEYV